MPSPRLGSAAPAELLTHLRQLRAELELPESFSPEASSEAEAAASLTFEDAEDRTDIPFVTIDPEGARDLDQALHIERAGDGYRVHYAIAAVGRFVQPGGALDREVISRATTVYGPGHLFPLHPLTLSAGAASLLAGEERPSYLWTLDLDGNGAVREGAVGFARVTSRAQLSYDEVQAALDDGTTLAEGVPADLPQLLAEVGEHRQRIEAERGGVSLNIPEQEVERTADGFELRFRATLPVEGYNAQISLMTGMEAARLMRESGTGVLRTLPPAQKRAIRALRLTAKALGLTWPESMTYPDFVRELDSAVPAQAAFLDRATTLFRGSGYETFDGGAPAEPRVHGAIAAEYAHVTAPLRRLVDRYGLEICLAHCEGREVPDWVRAALPDLPEVMAEGTGRANKYERGAVDIIEALILEPHVGENFDGVIVDVNEKGGRGDFQLADPAVHARIEGGDLPLGESVTARLASAEPARRSAVFSL